LGPFAYVLGAVPNEVEWGYGCSVDTMCGTNPTFEAIADTVLNSRARPTMVAFPLEAGDDDTNGSGIRVLNALDETVTLTGVALNGTNLVINCLSYPYAPVISEFSLMSSTNLGGPFTPVTATFTRGKDGAFQATTAISGSLGFYAVAYPPGTYPTGGSIVTLTNSSGAVTQSLTNIDFGQQYTCAAWDRVGNLYGASSTLNLWRAWSPPGAKTNTTVAVATLTAH
jgi:hypothetical protein